MLQHRNSSGEHPFFAGNSVPQNTKKVGNIYTGVYRKRGQNIGFYKVVMKMMGSVYKKGVPIFWIF